VLGEHQRVLSADPAPSTGDDDDSIFTERTHGLFPLRFLICDLRSAISLTRVVAARVRWHPLTRWN